MNSFAQHPVMPEDEEERATGLEKKLKQIRKNEGL
jgi:hypothetical protein